MSNQLFRCEQQDTWALTHTQITIQLSSDFLVSGYVTLGNIPAALHCISKFDQFTVNLTPMLIILRIDQ